MARRRKKKSNFFARFFTFLGKAVVWLIVALAKAIYYIFKGIFLGIGHLFKSKDKKTKKEKPGKQTDAKVEKKKSRSKGIKAEAKYQSLTSKQTKEKF